MLWELHNSSKAGCLLESQLELWDLTPITKVANCSFTIYRFFFGKGQKKSASISEKDKSPRIIHDAKPEEN